MRARSIIGAAGMHAAAARRRAAPVPADVAVPLPPRPAP
eukprot:SAG31_NODE_9210_length_1315_cov_2.577303_1_plen_38_part_10